VYKLAREFRRELKALSKEKFPPEENFCLRQQLWRALDSVVLNIAEGADKFSDKDCSRYLNNSLASLNEVMACVDLACDDEYFNRDDRHNFNAKAGVIAEQLMKFSRAVRRRNRK